MNVRAPLLLPCLVLLAACAAGAEDGAGGAPASSSNTSSQASTTGTSTHASSGDTSSGDASSGDASTTATTDASSTGSTGGMGGMASTGSTSDAATGTTVASSVSSSAMASSSSSSGGGPVDIGAYTYNAVPAPGLVNPPAAAWHPNGNYALVLNATNTVHRYDPITHTLSQVGTTSNGVSWRAVSFSPDGAKAVLLGNVASPLEGRVYIWDDATSTLSQMSTVVFAGGSYEGIEWSHDGTVARLLGSKSNAGSYIAYLWVFDLATGVSGLKAQATSAGCQDLAWATDAFDGPAVAVTCGLNGVTLFHLDSFDMFQPYSMNAGNTSRISARPQGDYALAIGWSGQRVYRYQQGNWTTSFGSPTFPGIFQVQFSTDGNRALVLGGYGGNPPKGQIYEFRDDLMQQTDFTDVSIPNFNLPPYNATSQDHLNDAAWRPGCEGGLIVGGSNTVTSTKALVVRFSVDNGVACPN